MKVLLVIPPFTQINTLYQSVGQLSGFLSGYGYEVRSLDLSLKVVLRIFSKDGLKKIFSTAVSSDDFTERMLSLSDHYIDIIDSVTRFLQGKNQDLAYRVVQEGFLPHSESFARVKEEKAFGYFGIQDKAKYYCSLIIDDLTRLIQKTITPHFGLSRYAEKIALSLSSFEPLERELKRDRNIIEKFMIEETDKVLQTFSAEVIGYSVPFPGNLLGALVSSGHIRSNYPDKKIVYGGGYINTELRFLKDPAIFNYTDYITFDDGELPLLNILQNKNRAEQKFVRTLMLSGGCLSFADNAEPKNIVYNDLPSPDINGIDPDEYISITEMLNPMHRLWSDGFWNKIAAAHGCYWRKCTFCDTTLDYIQRYSPARAEKVVDWMENLIEKTGRSSFHLTDEAAPPSLLKDISLEIIRRRMKVTWWGNIRFEKSFTADLCRLMAAAGCIAVSGGLEIADERLLKLINKGVTIEQTAGVCKNFRTAGIMVHAYLMYGFPTQTESEIINSLELVRQFMKLDLFQSAFWHKFSLTVHSPIAANSEKYNIMVDSIEDKTFAINDLAYKDKTGIDYDVFASGLNKALYNYMNGIGIEWRVQEWFDFQVPRPTVVPRHIEIALQRPLKEKQGTQFIWVSGKPVLKISGNNVCLKIHTNTIEGEWKVTQPVGDWLISVYKKSRGKVLPVSEFENSYPGTKDQFNRFLQSTVWKELRENVLILV